jgi:hypothetical protein
VPTPLTSPAPQAQVGLLLSWADPNDNTANLRAAMTDTQVATATGPRLDIEWPAVAGTDSVSFDLPSLLMGLREVDSSGASSRLGDTVARVVSLGTHGDREAGDGDQTSESAATGNGPAFSILGQSVDAAQMTGVAATAGFVWWITRGGGLLATVLMGVPAWRHIDLLPVLSRPLDDDEDDDEGAGDDAPDLDEMFERKQPAAHATAEAP